MGGQCYGETHLSLILSKMRKWTESRNSNGAVDVVSEVITNSMELSTTREATRC
jgi:hypothetical protein